MTSDIQAILQLLQRQTAAGPPAYSTITSSPDYQRTTLRGQSEAAPLTDLSLAAVQPRLRVSSSSYWGGGTESQKKKVPESHTAMGPLSPSELRIGPEPTQRSILSSRACRDSPRPQLFQTAGERRAHRAESRSGLGRPTAAIGVPLRPASFSTRRPRHLRNVGTLQASF